MNLDAVWERLVSMPQSGRLSNPRQFLETGIPASGFLGWEYSTKRISDYKRVALFTCFTFRLLLRFKQHPVSAIQSYELVANHDCEHLYNIARLAGVDLPEGTSLPRSFYLHLREAR